MDGSIIDMVRGIFGKTYNPAPHNYPGKTAAKFALAAAAVAIPISLNIIVEFDTGAGIIDHLQHQLGTPTLCEQAEWHHNSLKYREPNNPWRYTIVVPSDWMDIPPKEVGCPENLLNGVNGEGLYLNVPKKFIKTNYDNGNPNFKPSFGTHLRLTAGPHPFF